MEARDLQTNSFSVGLQISAECNVSDHGGDWKMHGMDLIFGPLVTVPPWGTITDVMDGIKGWIKV